MLKLKKVFSYMAVALLATVGFVGCDLLNNGQNTETAKYTVKYSSAQGTAPESIEVEENTVLSAEQLPELSADGYLFGGWYDGEDLAVAGTYKVTKDVTLTAKWENLPEDYLETKKTELFGKSFIASLTDSSDNKTYDAVIDIEKSTSSSGVESQSVKLTSSKYYMVCDTTDWSLSGNDVVLKAWEATSMSEASGRSADSPNVTLTFSSNLSDENPNKVNISYANIVTYAYDGQTEEEEKASLEKLTSAFTAFTVSRNQSASLSGSFNESPAMLDCYVDAMGGQQFGHAVFKGVSFKNNNGTIEATLKLGGGVGVIFSIPFIAYIEPSIKSISDDTYSTPKYYDTDGSLKDATYTTSTTDFGVRNNLNSSGTADSTVSKSYAVSSMTFPVSKDKSEYNLWIYINSNVMGVQFCDGSGTSSSNHPNEATKYVGKLVIDWDKVSVE